MEEESFESAYRALESRFRRRAEADGDVYVPNPEPSGVVDCIFVCMEPSLGRWADSDPEKGRALVEQGIRNFLYSMEDYVLHYAARHYLCRPDESYHVTDISKGAMLTDRASVSRQERYDRWYPLLREELDLLATEDTRIIAVGNAPYDYLTQKPVEWPLTQILHYSSQAARARNRAVEGREERFREFEGSVTHDDLLGMAEEVLQDAGVPEWVREETLSRLNERELTTSRQKLLFIYKEEFEELQASTP